MNNIYSSAYLYRFLRLVAKQQRIPTSVLQAWRSAANALLPAGSEYQDLREFDVDAAFQLYIDRQLGQYNTILPWQIHQHKNALESMLSDFFVFSAHPKQYLAALTAIHADEAVSAGGMNVMGRRPQASNQNSSAERRRLPSYTTTFYDILQSLPRPRRVRVISPLIAANDDDLLAGN